MPAITERDTTIDASMQWDGAWPQGRPGIQISPGGSGTGTLVTWADATTVRGIEFLSCGPKDTAWTTTKSAAQSFNTIGLKTVDLQVRDTRGLTDATIQQITVLEKLVSHRALLPLSVR